MTRCGRKVSPETEDFSSQPTPCVVSAGFGFEITRQFHRRGSQEYC